MNSINATSGFQPSPTNMLEKVQGNFIKADVNEDGALTKDEFMSAGEDKIQPSMLEKMFNRLDSNGEGW